MTVPADAGPAPKAYRAEIDGLRALAVLPVMAFHAHLPGFAGGYLGVDIFFCISGYLISHILLGQAGSGGVSLRHFYERRARRILPALFVMLLVATIGAMFLLLPPALRSYGGSLVASVLFVANIFFWTSRQDYFDPPSEAMPLLHLWSLAVEEQFYVFYPIVLALLLRLRGRYLLPVGALLLFGCMALSLAAGRVAPSAGFFLLPTRAWELLGGGLLAMAEHRRGGRGSGNARLDDWLCLTGVGLLAAGLFFVDRLPALPGLTGLPVIAGTALFLAFARADSLPGRAFAGRLPVAIGLVSYSAYLWHQPFLVFARALAPGGGTNRVAACVALGAALAAAYATWRWIEQPVRRGRPALGRFAALACAVAALLIGAGIVLRQTDGLPQRYDATARALLGLQETEIKRLERCVTTRPKEVSDPGCVVGAAGPVRIAFVGDSHAATVVPAFLPAMDAAGVRGVIAAASACAPVLADVLKVPDREGCTRIHAHTLAYLDAHPEIDTVVLAARWPYYIERSGFDNGEGGAEVVTTPPFDRAARARVAAAYAEIPRRLLAKGRRVVLVYPVPEAGWSVPEEMVRRRHSIAAATPLSTSRAAVARRTAAAVAALDGIGRYPNLLRLYPERRLCTLAHGTRCALQAGDQPLYSDAHHLTALGARLALPDIRLPAASRR